MAYLMPWQRPTVSGLALQVPPVPLALEMHQQQRQSETRTQAHACKRAHEHPRVNERALKRVFAPVRLSRWSV